jgi:CRP-like cAMP-binding protein
VIPIRKTSLLSYNRFMASNEGLMKTLLLIPGFADLDPNLLRSLADAAILRKYDPGQFVFLDGSENSYYYIVQEGWLKASKISAAGREQILQFLGPNTTFNLNTLFTGNQTQFAVEVLEPSSIWAISREDLVKLMDDNSALARILSGQLAEQVNHLIRLIENLALQTVETRLASIFLEHSTGEIMERRSWSTQAEMAARLGTVPDVLNRALKKLADEGLIQVQRQQIRILDREGLQRKALQQDW